MNGSLFIGGVDMAALGFKPYDGPQLLPRTIEFSGTFIWGGGPDGVVQETYYSPRTGACIRSRTDHPHLKRVLLAKMLAKLPREDLA